MRVDVAPQPAPPDELVLRVAPGPRDDWFAPDALRTLASRAYHVFPASNRIGLGAVQVPPDGRPVVFLADHPTTGGYPVIAVVRPVGLPAAALAVPAPRSASLRQDATEPFLKTEQK